MFKSSQKGIVHIFCYIFLQIAFLRLDRRFLPRICPTLKMLLLVSSAALKNVLVAEPARSGAYLKSASIAVR